jgi:hypothetical protein
VGAPLRWRVLTYEPVHSLAQEICVSGVATVLLDKIAHAAPQAGATSIGPGEVNELIEASVR